MRGKSSGVIHKFPVKLTSPAKVLQRRTPVLPSTLATIVFAFARFLIPGRFETNPAAGSARAKLRAAGKGPGPLHRRHTQLGPGDHQETPWDPGAERWLSIKA